MNELAALRYSEHQKVKDLMRKGHHLEALTLAQITLTKFGCHIALLCDQAANQYELGLFKACEETTFMIQTEFAKIKNQILPSTAFKTSIFAAKLFEELGYVQESLDLIEQSFSFTESDDDYQIALIQKIRMKSYFGETKDLISLLHEIRFNYLEESSTQVELLHGLMWGEWALFGIEQAFLIWNKLNELPLTPSDLRLINRDFLEMYLLTPTMNRQDVEPATLVLGQTAPLSFDQFLLDHFAESKFNPAYLYCPNLSVMQKLRILLIEIRACTNVSQELNLRKKFLFLLHQHPSVSSGHLMKLLGSLDAPPTVTLNQDFGQPHMMIGSSQFEINLYLFKMLTHLIEQGHLSLDEATRTVWDEEYTEQHYNRLRMLIYKVNHRVEAEYGFTLLSIKKSGITWEP